MRRLVTLMLALAIAPTAAAADGMAVSPVTVQLEAAEVQAQVQVANRGTAPWQAEARLYAWRQGEDRDVLEPAADLAASPAHFEVPPGGIQLLRLVRLGEAPARDERSYRLVIEQRLPGPVLTGPVRYSAPVFVLPDAALPRQPALLARVVPGPDGVRLWIANPGHLHARLAELAYQDAAGRRRALYPGLVGYVLPGQSRSWPLPGTPADYAAGRFLAEVNALGEQTIPAGTVPGDLAAP